MTSTKLLHNNYTILRMELFIRILLCLFLFLFAFSPMLEANAKYSRTKMPPKLTDHNIFEERKTSGGAYGPLVFEANVRKLMLPDVELESRLEQCALINRRGFPCETHYATTKDGFILTMFRIPPLTPTSKLPVLLQHGVFDWCENPLLM